LRIIKEGVAGKSLHLNFLGGGEQRLGGADGHLRVSGLKSVKKMTATWHPYPAAVWKEQFNYMKISQ
jgi:hypothetical protein